MNLTEIKAIDDDELRIKVAELLGWYDLSGCPLSGSILDQESGIELHGVPDDYPSDLNACHEMEGSLVHTPDESTWSEYRECLVGMLGKEWGFATARQRCEAFVLTTGET